MRSMQKFSIREIYITEKLLHQSDVIVLVLCEIAHSCITLMLLIANMLFYPPLSISCIIIMQIAK